jgi:hypothetical protein
MQNDEIAERAAVDSAEKWLVLIDRGDVSQSWNQPLRYSKPLFPPNNGKSL